MPVTQFAVSDFKENFLFGAKKVRPSVRYSAGALSSDRKRRVEGLLDNALVSGWEDIIIMKQPTLRPYLLILAATLIAIALAGPAKAEMYIAGQVGIAVPQDASQINLKVDPNLSFPTSLTNLDQANSGVFGGKVGYYFDSLKSLGIETEAFTVTPKLKEQSASFVTEGQPAFPFNFPGANLRVTTWAFNLVARYPGERFQPYAGAGVGIYFANLKTVTDSDTSIKPGVNLQAGMRYLVTPHVAIFSEWKFNHTTFNFNTQSIDPSVAGFTTRYNSHMFVLGIGYHF